MDYRLSDEQAALAQAVRAFVANECPREEARALDARSAFPAEPARQLGALGLYGLNVPEEFGGAGLDLLATALVIAELAQSAPVLAIAFSGVALRGSRAIAEWGSPAQQQALFPLLTSGETCLTFAAGPEDDPVIAAIGAESEFRLDGLAQHAALADRAHALLTLANTSAGLTVFVVPTSSTGLVLSPVDKVGTRGVSLSRVRYDHVRVTPEQILGGPGRFGKGAAQWEGLQALAAVETAALCLGISQGALEYATGYAEERVQFGKSIASFEAIQHLLVDMTTDVHALRLALWEACARANREAAWLTEAAMARLMGVTVARRTALQCLHILGGYGYTLEYDAQRYVRDALSLVDGSASVELLKSELGAMLGFGSRPSRGA